MDPNPVADLVRRSHAAAGRRRPPKILKNRAIGSVFCIITYKILFSVVSSPNTVLAFGMVRGDWPIQ